MTNFSHLIGPGLEFTGERLTAALRQAGAPPCVGPGLQMSGGNSAGGPCISLRRERIIPGLKAFPAKIEQVDDLVIGSGRFFYEWREQRLGAAFGVWEDKPKGRMGPFALNIAEANNTSDNSGIQGYGVILDSDDATIMLRPIRVGSIIFLTAFHNPNGTLEYWFEADNPIQVVCNG